MANHEPAAPPRTLVLCEDAAWASAGESAADLDTLTWAKAQEEGQRRFNRYNRFLCLSAAFPRDRHDHQRDAMITRLRRRLSRRALAIFTIPYSDLPLSEVDEVWNHARFLVEHVTGTRLERVAECERALEVADGCQPATRAWVLQNPSTAEFAIDGYATPRVVALDECLVLAGEDLVEAPRVVAGFPGRGAWLVLPAAPGESSARGVARLTALLSDLEALRRDHQSLRAQRELEVRVARENSSSSRGRKSGARRTSRELPAPVKALDDAKLYAIPRDGGRGFLQRKNPRGDYVTSPMLHAGPWTLATVILNPDRDGAGESAALAYEQLTSALEEAGIPSSNPDSVSRYLSELRRALQCVLDVPKDLELIRSDRRRGTVHLDGLRTVLEAIGGSAVESFRGRTSPGGVRAKDS